MAESIRALVAQTYKEESRRVLATLIRLLGDFDLAEEALHDAFHAAVEQWVQDGVPDNPRAWLVSTGRFKAIDKIRRRQHFDGLQHELVATLGAGMDSAELRDDEGLEDDRLRLIFVCCHPGLSAEAQVAMTLREVCDLSTEDIARAYLCKPSTIAQRIVRAKNKIRDAGISYRVPPPSELPSRLESVLRVLYLVFNEGYAASSGAGLLRSDLSNEAIRVCELVFELLPDPEVQGLLALMLFHDARRQARTDAQGNLVLLEDQDRSVWDAAKIKRAQILLDNVFRGGRIGVYGLQAAIAGAHATTESADRTPWPRIVMYYDWLLRLNPSPVVELNRAVAVAMRDGPDVGLALIDQLMANQTLEHFHPAHAARAELCRRLGQKVAAEAAYEKALACADREAERRHMQTRLSSLRKL